MRRGMSKEKSIGQNLAYIDKHPLHITIEWRHMPGGCEHNLMCWLCGKNKAVYNMHPNWRFEPCWKCQESMDKPKKWYEFWK